MAYVVVTFEFVVCCASFAVFALFGAQTMRTSRGKNIKQNKKKRLKLLPKGVEFCCAGGAAK